MEIIMKVALSGLAGTIGMVLVMSAIHRLGLANADMVRAIGSIVTRTERSAFIPGLTLHCMGGISFAFVYALVVGAAPVSSNWVTFFLCTALSIGHGMVVSLLIAVMVAEHHPIKRFRDADGGVVAAHLAGHIMYGMIVGLMLMSSGARIIPSELTSGATTDILGFAAFWFSFFGLPLIFMGYIVYSTVANKAHDVAVEQQDIEERSLKNQKRKTSKAKGAARLPSRSRAAA